MLKFEIVWS